MEKKLYSVKEVMEMLGVCRSTLHKMCEEKTLDKIKIGRRRVVITKESVDKLLSER